jgi:hypothetical protein
MTGPVCWRVSSFTNNGQCVELADVDNAILVRNSNHPDAGTLTLGPEAMAAFVEDVKAGRLDHHA